MALIATWHGAGVKAKQPPNPDFPAGLNLDMAPGRVGCAIDLEYPAPEVGHWLIECSTCRRATVVTAAGRPDDPKSVRIACGPRVPFS
jgi:hypothetical protein